MNIPSLFRSFTVRRSALFLTLLAVLIPAIYFATAQPAKEASVKVLPSPLSAVKVKEKEKTLTSSIESKEVLSSGNDSLESKAEWANLAETVEPASAKHYAQLFEIPLEWVATQPHQVW